jgi:Mg2+-importing ATPase
MPASRKRTRRGHRLWLTWPIGFAVLLGVIIVVTRLSEAGAFVALIQAARPRWLLSALALHAATYAAQAVVWHLVSRKPGRRTLPFWDGIRIGVAKQFVDHVVPSAGISGTVFAAKAFRRHGLSQLVLRAAVAVNLITANLAFAIGVSAALVIAAIRGQYHGAIIVPAALFAMFSGAFATTLLRLPGRRVPALPRSVAWLPGLREGLRFVAGADPRIVRQPGLLLHATAWQSLIILMHAAALLLVIRALGVELAFPAVFASFMLSSLVRSMGIVPGGLGTFEAMSVFTLRLAGATPAVALSATLLFRGITFWLPMLPGLWFSRRLAGRRTDR